MRSNQAKKPSQTMQMARTGTCGHQNHRRTMVKPRRVPGQYPGRTASTPCSSTEMDDGGETIARESSKCPRYTRFTPYSEADRRTRPPVRYNVGTRWGG